MRLPTILYALSYYFVTFIVTPFIFITLTNFFYLPVFHNIILQISGLFLIIIGICNSFYSYRFFFIKGKGTPVPIQPTRKLITDGFYKYTRNPIYISHFLFTVGIFLFFGDSLLIIYCLLFALWAHFYTLYEEKELKKRFGNDYITYMKTVPRYLPNKFK